MGYGFCCLLFIIIKSTPEVHKRIHDLRGLDLEFLMTNAALLVMYCTSIAVLVALTKFLRFHLKLLFRNSTSIEELQRCGGESRFDMGMMKNLGQVFGTAWFLCGVPLRLPCTQPCGDGVNWDKN